jgi:hypothetical protein
MAFQTSNLAIAALAIVASSIDICWRLFAPASRSEIWSERPARRIRAAGRPCLRDSAPGHVALLFRGPYEPA